MKKYLFQFSFLLLLLASQNFFGQVCDMNSPNVEITFTSVEVIAGCDGDPTLQTQIEPTISINGSVLTFSPSSSADGAALGANSIPGVYSVTNGDLIDGCSASTTIGIGGANGSTMVPVNVEIWEEDGCGSCSYGTGSTCNDDADYVNLGSQMVDITMPSGSFATGCYIFNYDVACPPPCDETCDNEVSIMFTSIDAAGCDGDFASSTIEAAISIGGTVYEFTINDNGNTVVSGAIETCNGGADTYVIGTVLAGGTATLPGVEVWEEDGCGDCSYGTGSTCDDDADYVNVGNTVIDLNAPSGSLVAGCLTYNYDIICESFCCLANPITTGAVACAGDNSTFDVFFEVADLATTYEVVDGAGTVLGSGATSPITATVTGPTTAGQTVDVFVHDSANSANCASPTVQVTLIECPDICDITNGTWSK